MPRKRIVKLKINEISGVDTPAQEGAQVLLMKRHDGKTNKPEDKVQKVLDDLASLIKSIKTGDNKMPEETVETLKAELETQKTELAAKVAELEKVQNVAALPANHKEHYEKMDATEQTAFLAKDETARKTEVDLAEAAQKDADPVVYTTKKGIEIRKSAGPVLVEVLKANDAMAEELAEVKKVNADQLLRKRAEDELKHFPGTVETRIAILKSVESITDETERETALTSLKAQDEALSKAFDTVGHMDGTVDAGSPEGQLEKLAQKYADDHKVAYNAAYAKVMETPEGEALYTKMEVQVQ